MSGPFSTSTAPYDICLRIFVTILALKSTVPLTKKVWVGVEGQGVLFPRSGISLGVHLFGRIQSKAPVSQLVNADDTSVIEIKTQLYLES